MEMISLENDVVAMEIKQVTMLSDFASVALNDVTLIKLQHHNATKLQSIWANFQNYYSKEASQNTQKQNIIVMRLSMISR